MWVWIPRYAYKITYKNPENKSEGGTIEVRFLEGTSDNYSENGELKTAKRQTTEDEMVDTTIDFYVHPAFTNETSINFANGGWDRERTGMYVCLLYTSIEDTDQKREVENGVIGIINSLKDFSLSADEGMIDE